MRKRTTQAGVTLIEMIIVVGIIAVVSSVVMFNYSDFSTNVSIRNLSQEIALAIRKSQAYATSVHTIDGLSVDSRTFQGYGISFAPNLAPRFDSDGAPSTKRFILFADTEQANSEYEDGGRCGDPAPGNECVETFDILTSDKIIKICNRTSCSDDARVDISFHRPSPDATICYRATYDDPCVNTSVATIWLESAKGLQRSVSVYTTGQISVQ